LDKVQVNRILEISSTTEHIIASIYAQRYEFSVAENHCERALSQAKRHEGEANAFLLLRAYTVYCELRRRQNNFTDAVTFAEEGYNSVAMAYNPVHFEVLTAAGTLIECLIHTGNPDALTYAQLTLESLKDPANGVDQSSEDVALGYYNLGRVILKQKGDFVKAEGLARESYRIRVQLLGNDHHFVGLSGNLLAGVLETQDKLGDETKNLYEHALAIAVRTEGPDSHNTATRNANLGQFYARLVETVTSDEKKDRDLRFKYMKNVYFYFKETARIFTKIYGSSDSKTITYAFKVSALKDYLSTSGYHFNG
jgi:hypothetical protein